MNYTKLILAYLIVDYSYARAVDACVKGKYCNEEYPMVAALKDDDPMVRIGSCLIILEFLECKSWVFPDREKAIIQTATKTEEHNIVKLFIGYIQEKIS